MVLMTKEILQNLKARENVSGVILVQDYNIGKTKNGNEYIMGTLLAGITIPFKAWGNSTAFSKLKKEDYKGIVTCISGNVDDYGGSLSIILDNVTAVEGYTPDQFFPIKYNMEAYWNGLKVQFESLVSDKAMDICNLILFENEEVSARFKVEFAAMTYHDNCKSGLLAHTYKVLSNLAWIIKQYPDITNREGSAEDYRDLLYTGALLHDIGKIIEMQFGTYTEYSYVTHRFFGAEMLIPFKSKIIELYNEDWYYQLMSIILQHHGEFGEPCKTIAAYLVNKADELDAQMTLLATMLSDKNNESGMRIKVDGNYLTY